jgi:hypothetical protein
MFSMQLNEMLPELEDRLPPTDTRWRMDLRAMETGAYAKAWTLPQLLLANTAADSQDRPHTCEYRCQGPAVTCPFVLCSRLIMPKPQGARCSPYALQLCAAAATNAGSMRRQQQPSGCWTGAGAAAWSSTPGRQTPRRCHPPGSPYGAQTACWALQALSLGSGDANAFLHIKSMQGWDFLAPEPPLLPHMGVALKLTA